MNDDIKMSELARITKFTLAIVFVNATIAGGAILAHKINVAREFDSGESNYSRNLSADAKSHLIHDSPYPRVGD